MIYKTFDRIIYHVHHEAVHFLILFVIIIIIMISATVCDREYDRVSGDDDQEEVIKVKVCECVRVRSAFDSCDASAPPAASLILLLILQ